MQGIFTAVNLSPGKGPDIPLFKRFKERWDTINHTRFVAMEADKEVKEILKDVNKILLYANTKIEEHHPLDNYQELLELIIIVLRHIPQRGINFRRPGAFHLGRWMSKAIYCLKIYLFRNQFKLTLAEEKAVRRICCFIIRCYSKTWFSAANAIEAPLNDINFLKELVKYKNYDQIVADQGIHKFINHLWYLSEECAAFSIFDERLSDEIRREMAQKILQKDICPQASINYNTDQIEVDKRNKLFVKESEVEYVLTKNLPLDLLSSRSLNMFRRFHISTDFLTTDPSRWKDQKGYNNGKVIIASLKVVNDTAERGVKLMEEFNQRFTENEEQKQFVLQVCALRL